MKKLRWLPPFYTGTDSFLLIEPLDRRKLKNLIDFLSHNFIRLGRTRAKALQTVSRFPRETRRRYAARKSNNFTL